ncbi:MAG TPA: PIN domain-containing protein, partial [Candidatus Dormibacteraeota bacterium]|nr:PIN domain-containing protein [Candidatus Dormibacteraeota bacterium]
RQLWERGGGSLVTTNHVLGETWTFLQRRVGHPEACRFLAAAARLPSLVTRHVDDDMEAEAWRWLVRHDERRYSFVDATGFVTMRRLRIGEALAFDGDFSAAGFVEVRG